MILVPSPSLFGLVVHTPFGSRREGGIRVLNGLVVCLYVLGQSSSHELVFGVELGPDAIFL